VAGKTGVFFVLRFGGILWIIRYEIKNEAKQQPRRDVVCVVLVRLAFTTHNEEMGNTNWF
jgi:hypothetical protein